jgi:colanic acid/amylovoran biosynthesis glycosyltransferase
VKHSLKIAIYSGELPSTTFVERLIVGLSERHHQILLFGRFKKKIDYKNTSIRCIAFSDTKLHKLLFFAKYSFLLYFFRSKEKKKLDTYILKSTKNSRISKIKYYPVLWHKPDLFHLQWAKSVGDWMWVQDFGMKIIVSLRGAHINYSPITKTGLAEHYRTFFPKVDGFHAVSYAIGLEAEKYGADSERIRVVYSGFPLAVTPLPSTVYKNEIKTVQLLSIGRSHWKKGYNYALDACYLLRKKGVDFHYTIIGAKGVEELEYQRNDLGLIDCVSFLDSVPYKEVLTRMQEAHVILLPSVEEGIANVVLEGMMLQKIVLTTDCGGMEEIVHEGVNGFVIPIRQPKEMSEKIIEICKLSEIEINKITSNARNTIEMSNSEEKMVRDMEGLYDFVLNNTTNV